jgi:hypothetical protein
VNQNKSRARYRYPPGPGWRYQRRFFFDQLKCFEPPDDWFEELLELELDEEFELEFDELFELELDEEFELELDELFELELDEEFELELPATRVRSWSCFTSLSIGSPISPRSTAACAEADMSPAAASRTTRLVVTCFIINLLLVLLMPHGTTGGWKENGRLRRLFPEVGKAI